MPLDLWLAFVAACIVVLMLPGPTILMVVGTALGRGRLAGLATVPGVMLGDFVAMTASLAGLGALMAASAVAFTVMKWIGAAYLVYLGIRMWRQPAVSLDASITATSHRRLGFQAFAVTALNPKSIAFFVAFVPQFIDPAHPLLLQLVVLEATFLVLAGANAALYALLAALARRTITRPRTLRALNRVGGGALIGAGAMTAMVQRTT